MTIEFSLSTRQQETRAAVHSLAENIVRPQSLSWDRNHGIPDDLRVSITNAADPDAYPIAAFTYFLIPVRISIPDKKQAIIAFLDWMLTSGQRQSASVGYAALPDIVIARERQVLDKIR